MPVSIGLIAILRTLLAGGVAASAPTPQAKIIARINLSKPFHLPPGASFTATQGPQIASLWHPDDDLEPGRIQLCIKQRPSGPCSPNLENELTLGGKWDTFAETHFLETAELIRPRGPASNPALHLQFSSVHSGDGDQRRAVVILTYRPASRRFVVVYRKQIGNNHNEEVRYIRSGPLKGSIVAAISPYGPPFSYLIEVSQLTPDYRYRRVLRFRSATLYGDGNPLAVVDSEMPNILRRLGLWRPGQSLPLPASRCLRPHLVKAALWCS